MNQENTEDRKLTDAELWWGELPETVREGFLAEQEMWEYAKKLNAEIMKPHGILGFFGYRIRLP